VVDAETLDTESPGTIAYDMIPGLPWRLTSRRPHSVTQYLRAPQLVRRRARERQQQRAVLCVPAGVVGPAALDVHARPGNVGRETEGALGAARRQDHSGLSEGVQIDAVDRPKALRYISKLDWQSAAGAAGRHE